MGCKHNWCYKDELVTIKKRMSRFICSECGYHKDIEEKGEITECSKESNNALSWEGD